MRSFVHVAVTLCALAFCAGPTLQDTVKVSVYYESLCPDSVAFIDNQLVPTFKKLSKAIDLDLVPYGKANQTLNKGHWQFTCQHGPEECKGNKLHACLVDSLYPKRSNKLVKVIGCLMGNDDHFKALHQCARKVKLNPAKFIRCAKSVKGENLLAALGDRTHKFTPKITYIPTIAFNDTLASFAKDTYPYEQIGKYSTTEDSFCCRIIQCSQAFAKVIDHQAVAMPKWDKLKPTLWGDTEVVKQFDRLETMFSNARYFNLSLCIQDFDQVLTVQKAVYDNVFNICVAEATKQNYLDNKTNMAVIKRDFKYLDSNTSSQVRDCGSNNDCKPDVENFLTRTTLPFEENRAAALSWCGSRG